MKQSKNQNNKNSKNRYLTSIRSFLGSDKGIISAFFCVAVGGFSLGIKYQETKENENIAKIRSEYNEKIADKIGQLESLLGRLETLGSSNSQLRLENSRLTEENNLLKVSFIKPNQNETTKK